jgi:leucyl/phenylalanyl-tRNA---protein transferase
MISLQASSFRDRVYRCARRTLRAAAVPVITVLQPLAGLINLRISYVWSTPTAPEVVGNYTRGLVLFGRSGARWVKFEWRSFPTRAVITKETAKVPKSLHRIQRRGEMEVRFDQDFEEIIRGCQEGRTAWMWITPALIDVYRDVRSLGFISTVGTYRDGRLVGGLWGIGIGDAFGLMSMFHREDHAGSLAMAALVNALLHEGRWSVVDFGVMTPNFSRYGAQEVSSAEFCEVLRSRVEAEMAGLASAGSAGLAGQRPHRRDPVR